MSTSDIIEFSTDGTWKSFSNKSELHVIVVHVEYSFPQDKSELHVHVHVTVVHGTYMYLCTI